MGGIDVRVGGEDRSSCRGYRPAIEDKGWVLRIRTEFDGVKTWIGGVRMESKAKM